MRNRLTDYPMDFWPQYAANVNDIDTGGAEDDDIEEAHLTLVEFPSVVTAIQRHLKAIAKLRESMGNNVGLFDRRYHEPAKQLLQMAEKMQATMDHDCDRAERTDP